MSCSRFSNKSLQKHRDGSETDHIEGGLQSQYQRSSYNPEMLYGWPVGHFIKNIAISSTISMFEVTDVLIFRNRDFDDLIHESYTAFCQEFHCANARSIE